MLNGTNIRELSFFTGRGGPSICEGDQFFLGWSKAGGSFFSLGQGGDQNFSGVQEEGHNFFQEGGSKFFAPSAQYL